MSCSYDTICKYFSFTGIPVKLALWYSMAEHTVYNIPFYAKYPVWIHWGLKLQWQQHLGRYINLWWKKLKSKNFPLPSHLIVYCFNNVLFLFYCKYSKNLSLITPEVHEHWVANFKWQFTAVGRLYNHRNKGPMYYYDLIKVFKKLSNHFAHTLRYNYH